MSNQKLSTQPYEGTRNFYPNEMKLRNWFFGKIRGYGEGAEKVPSIETPLYRN